MTKCPRPAYYFTYQDLVYYMMTTPNCRCRRDGNGRKTNGDVSPDVRNAVERTLAMDMSGLRRPFPGGARAMDRRRAALPAGNPYRAPRGDGRQQRVYSVARAFKDALISRNAVAKMSGTTPLKNIRQAP